MTESQDATIDDPTEIAAFMLDRLALREVFDDRRLWMLPSGPCGLLGSMSDEIDTTLANLKMRGDREGFEARAIELDTDCARGNRAFSSEYARAAQELRWGPGWRSQRQPCEKCGQRHTMKAKAIHA